MTTHFIVHLKEKYLSKAKKPHSTKMQSIVKAYEEIKEQSIVNCFKLCGCLDSVNSTHVIDKLISEGYGADDMKKQQIEKMSNSYRMWKRNVRTGAPNIPSE